MAQNIKYKMSWTEFEKDVKKLAHYIGANEVRMLERYSGFYGMPRGGLIIAVRLSHLLNLPLLSKPRKDCIVIDDVSDSGETLRSFQPHVTATLHRKSSTVCEPDFYVRTINKWICYPWEEGGKDD